MTTNFNMDSTLFYFARGLAIGFLIAMPVGPIGVLCIRRSAVNGLLSGLFTGLGAATADACYGAIAAFGLTLFSGFLIENAFWFQIFGVVFLTYLGIKTMVNPPPSRSTSAAQSQLLRDYASTFALTLTNPTTIASFAIVFAGVGVISARSFTVSGIIVLGVFLGSAIWWLILSTSVGLFRNKINERVLAGINRFAGLLLIGFALLFLFKAVSVIRHS